MAVMVLTGTLPQNLTASLRPSLLSNRSLCPSLSLCPQTGPALSLTGLRCFLYGCLRLCEPLVQVIHDIHEVAELRQGPGYHIDHDSAIADGGLCMEGLGFAAVERAVKGPVSSLCIPGQTF